MKKIITLFILLIVFSCGKNSQNNNLVATYTDNNTVISLANEIYSDGLVYKNLNKVFYDTLFNIDTKEINKEAYQCNKSCYSKLAMLEAIMLLVNDKAKASNLTFDTKPFYKWKEKVINGEDIPLNFFDNITPTP